MGNSKNILKYLGMIPRVSLFSNTRLNTFINTAKGKEGFANKEEEQKAYCENKELIITIRVIISVIITILAGILFMTDGNNNVAAFAVCAIAAVLVPDLTLIIMLVMIAVQSADKSVSAVKEGAQPGYTVASASASAKNLSDNFFLSETPN